MVSLNGAGMTRRKFLEVGALAAVGLGVVGYVDRRGLGGIVCSRCGTRFLEGHRHEEGTVEGVYCPGCGVEIRTLSFQVDRSVRFVERARGKEAKGKGRRKKEPAALNWAQVPFPNRRRVLETNKAAVAAEDLDVGGRRWI